MGTLVLGTYGVSDNQVRAYVTKSPQKTLEGFHSHLFKVESPWGGLKNSTG
jgi:hypothetical protein